MRVSRWIMVLLIGVMLATTGLGCKGPSAAEQQASKPVTLTYWRVWDSPEDLQPAIDAYRALHPNVKIEVRNFRFEEYEQKLLDALAEDRGPDLFSVHNTWVNKYLSKITPAPATVTIPFQQQVQRLGGFSQEVQIEMRTNRIVSPTQVKNNFVDVVADDVVWPSGNSTAVYGLPFSVDTMVLFFNRDLLNAVGIPEPPRTWLEFQSQVKKIVRQDKQGAITRAGAALGTANNIDRSFDILSLLMLQNGTVMTQSGRMAFQRTPTALENVREVPPADEATIFYTDFAYPAKEVYTWNDAMPAGLDAFINGQVAFFFGYSYHLVTLKDRAPKLNLGYVAMPQIEGNPSITYANYWVETVSKKSANSDWAWDFLNFAATDPNQVKQYLDRTQKPTALRALIPVQVEQETLLPFVNQLLTARSWYRGKDPAAAEQIFKDLINAVLTGSQTVREAINLAAGRMQQTY